MIKLKFSAALIAATVFTGSVFLPGVADAAQQSMQNEAKLPETTMQGGNMAMHKTSGNRMTPKKRHSKRRHRRHHKKTVPNNTSSPAM
ncbi:MAG: hypothetical protein ABIP75_09195 [Pyrinomonadaceae bacterium]